MDIPASCADWETQMDSDDDARRILANITADQCVAPDVERMFFENVAGRGAPGSPGEAVDFAKDAVRNNAATHLCSGKQVPPDRMTKLARVCKQGSLRYILPEPARRRFESKFAANAATPLEGNSARILRRKTAWLAGEIGFVPVRLGGAASAGNPERIVWATDATAAEIENPLDGEVSHDLIDRLGLKDLESESCCWVLTYPRSEVEADARTRLHVPRVLDAIGHPPFRPEPDCDAPVGRSHPLSGDPSRGLPEAVHRTRELQLAGMEAARINHDSA